MRSAYRFTFAPSSLTYCEFNLSVTARTCATSAGLTSAA